MKQHLILSLVCSTALTFAAGPLEPSRFAKNKFLSATVNRYPLMSEILTDSLSRATAGNATFTPGGLYQLWLCAVNSKGRSAPGPVKNWTAA